MTANTSYGLEYGYCKFAADNLGSCRFTTTRLEFFLQRTETLCSYTFAQQFLHVLPELPICFVVELPLS